LLKNYAGEICAPELLEGCADAGAESLLQFPSLFHHAIHAAGANQVIHYDFLYISRPSKTASLSFKHILVIMDDSSGCGPRSRSEGAVFYEIWECCDIPC
jgi:hypothetical protein